MSILSAACSSAGAGPSLRLAWPTRGGALRRGTLASTGTRFTAGLPPEEAEALLARARPVPQAPELEAPDVKITGADVWAVLEAAKGRCEHCRPLAVESRLSGPNGKPLSWAQVGRRIGSLGHRQARFSGGSNAPGNLSWTCLWCNTWPSERHPGATDHGGIPPSRE